MLDFYDNTALDRAELIAEDRRRRRMERERHPLDPEGPINHAAICGVDPEMQGADSPGVVAGDVGDLKRIIANIPDSTPISNELRARLENIYDEMEMVLTLGELE